MLENDPGKQSSIEQPTLDALSLGRTNNFRLIFLDDSGAVVNPRQMLIEQLGELWIKFKTEHRDLYDHAHDLVHELTSRREAILPVEEQRRLLLDGKFDELAQFNQVINRELGDLGREVRVAVEACFDTLVRMGANPTILEG